MTDQVNYDQVAPTYHRRYDVNPLPGVAAALRALVQELQPERVLEVGCGTGRWLAELRSLVGRVYGLDLSPGMLRQARQQLDALDLVQGSAVRLPWPAATFDLVFCVNALHHFNWPRRFVTEARRLLRPGGCLAIVNSNPHPGRDRWYLYDYFEGTLQTDLTRFPSAGTMVDWLAAGGFDHLTWRVVERIQARLVGKAVLADHFLQKHGTSQLTLLSDTAYTAGLRRIEAALAEAEAQQKTVIFETDLTLGMLTGWVPPIEANGLAGAEGR